MKSLHLNMYKKINYIAAVLVLLTSISVKAQVTTQSPYSRYGIGNIKGTVLPQFRAMGGISTAVYKPNVYNNINMQNPASYAGINLTTVDIGISGGGTQLKKGDQTEGSYNANISHVALAFPVSKRSALSFGLIPYSELGYQYQNSATLSTPGNTSTQTATYIYSGEGGLTKAYMGYGFGLGDHFRLGGNVEYLFGNLIQSRSTELADVNSINSRMQNKNSIGGISFSYGAQYEIPVGDRTSITLGYSGSSSSNINSKTTFVATQYLPSTTTTEEENSSLDTLSLTENSKTKFKLPLIHNFGIAFQKNNKWLIGADYRMGKWSDLTIGGVNQDLQDTYGVSVGGQITPDITSIGSYFNHVDYRAGFSYDKTYISINDQDIKQMAVSFGFGFPLRSTPLTIYKINFTTELGKRGTVSNGLLEEKFINFHLGFTLNDKWFRKLRFD
jgi:long-subunit fatty acid transport protein